MNNVCQIACENTACSNDRIPQVENSDYLSGQEEFQRDVLDPQGRQGPRQHWRTLISFTQQGDTSFITKLHIKNS